MKGRRRALAAALALAAAWPLAGAQTTAVEAAAPVPGATPATAAEAAEAGRKVYVISCQRCHGINLATNGIGFDLRTFPQNDKARFVRAVTQGLRAMPALGASLKPGQLDQIWAYIGSVNGWKDAPVAQ